MLELTGKRLGLGRPKDAMLRTLQAPTSLASPQWQYTGKDDEAREFYGRFGFVSGGRWAGSILVEPRQPAYP